MSLWTTLKWLFGRDEEETWLERWLMVFFVIGFIFLLALYFHNCVVTCNR